MFLSAHKICRTFRRQGRNDLFLLIKNAPTELKLDSMMFVHIIVMQKNEFDLEISGPKLMSGEMKTVCKIIEVHGNQQMNKNKGLSE